MVSTIGPGKNVGERVAKRHEPSPTQLILQSGLCSASCFASELGSLFSPALEPESDIPLSFFMAGSLFAAFKGFESIEAAAALVEAAVTSAAANAASATSMTDVW